MSGFWPSRVWVFGVCFQSSDSDTELSVHVWFRAAGPTAFTRFICYQRMSTSENTELPNEPQLDVNCFSQSALLLLLDPSDPDPETLLEFSEYLKPHFSDFVRSAVCTWTTYCNTFCLVFNDPSLVLYLDRLDCPCCNRFYLESNIWEWMNALTYFSS